jgi:hypothetical protein
MSMLPVPGNLAWAPVPAIENVEVLDRFNGVPTFGVFTAGGERQLFWRVTGYVPFHVHLALRSAHRRGRGPSGAHRAD